MNERIKELALQAGLSHMPSNYPDMADLYKGADFELAKFAELIVRECGEIAYKAYWDNPETVKGIHIQEKIKQHFGVEE